MSATRSPSLDSEQASENAPLITAVTAPTYGGTNADLVPVEVEAAASPDEDTIVINTADYVKPTPPFEEDFFWDWQSLLLGACRTGANLLEPLMAYFLYQSISEIGTTLAEETGIGSTLPWLLVMFNVITAFLVATHALNNMSSVNIPEDVMALCNHSGPDEQPPTHPNVIRALTVVNNLLSVPSIGLFAASNALAIAYLSENTIIRWIAGTSVTGLALTSFLLFDNDVKKHTREFIERITDKKSNLVKIVHSPLLSAEVAVEALSNMLHHAIGAGYITQQLLKRLLSIAGSHPITLPLIASASVLAAYNTAITSTLPIHHDYFNKEWQVLRNEELQQTPLRIHDWLANVFLAATRGAGTAYLSWKFIPGHIALKAGLALTTGLLTFSHNLYALTYKTRHKLAYRQHQRQQQLERHTFSPDDDSNATTVFDRLAKEYQTPNLRRVVTVMNGGAGAARWFSFVGTLLSLKTALKENGIPVPFELLDILFLALGWGTATIFANKAAYELHTRETWAYWRTSWNIGPPNERIAQKCLPSRVVQSLFYPKSHYPLLTLHKAEERHRQEAHHSFQMV